MKLCLAASATVRRGRKEANRVQVVTAALIERCIKPQDSRTRNCGCRVVAVFAHVRLPSTRSKSSRTAVCSSYFGNPMGQVEAKSSIPARSSLAFPRSWPAGSRSNDFLGAL